MQETQKRISQHDLSSQPTRIRVIGYTYLVDFGPSTQPRFHTINKQRSCSCPLKETCPAIEAVAEYLRSGGQRAPAHQIKPVKARLKRISPQRTSHQPGSADMVGFAGDLGEYDSRGAQGSGARHDPGSGRWHG